ncbi:MAG TPA: protein kinase [Bryobacteraceae bacterium]|nr:protein kinase [Bryobacteraceae bacterium]
MPLAAGDRLGPYEIIEPIGAGGMGQVYKASDTRLGRIVAVKISNERFTERFEHEARAVAALNHPNICTLYDVGPNYLVMEYIEGESPRGPMPLEDALRIGRQIAEALEAAHERGITHRDLKPANIKIKPDGTVKVLDFGLAKVAATTSGSDERSPTFTIGMTEAGMVLGTASYMAPEQARGKAVDKRADIFAFGVVLYEMITGKRLFGGEDAGEMLAKVIRDEPDLSDAPSSVQRLLTECLRKDPRKRLRDIGDVWRMLDGPPASSGAPEDRQGGAKPGSVKWLWPAAVAILMLTTAALAFVHFREKPPVLAPMRFEVALPLKDTLNAFAVSPDGRKLVLNLRAADGRSELWLRMMDSLNTRKLAGTEDANLDPAWSPDSQSIAFLAGGNVKRTDISGGTPQILASYSNPATGISWGRDDIILFGSAGVINRIPASGGEVTPLTAMDSQHGEQGHGRPFLLPDGKHFLYYRLFADRSGLYLGSLDAKPSDQAAKRLLDSPAGAMYVGSASQGYLLFLRGTALMSQPFDTRRLELTGRSVQLADRVSANLFDGLFSASNTGVLGYAVTGGDNRQLTWYDRQGKVLGHLGEPTARDELSLSPDGTRVVEGRTDDQGLWTVWMLDVARGANTRLTFEAGGGNGTWSPDGRQIVYAPAGGQSPDLYLKPANGAAQGERLFHTEDIVTPTDWSRDGRFLLFSRRGKNRKSDLWVLPMTGDRKPAPYLVTPFVKAQAQFSPDGHWVVYTSSESGTREVYVQPFPMSSGGKWVVSSGGGSQPRWSHDGKELFYFTPDETLMDVAVNTAGGTFQLGIPKALFRASILGGSGGAIASSWRWDISADGKRFLVNTALDDAAASPVTVLLNWQSLTK